MLSKGPTIRIKLSTPTDWKSVRLDVVSGNPVLGFDKVTGGITTGSLVIRKKNLTKLELMLDGKKYTGGTISLSADIVRISNWDRKPSWDTSGKLNDNTFRGKLEVRIKANKLEVINELPLEDYLKGLAEISNGNNPEKVKTILVAARSYALWYTDPNNRKFPGKDYDGSDDPEIFQKYLGYGYESRSGDTAKLVEATNGQVVTYNGNLVKPWYFNDSDGRTRSAKEYCESNGGKNCLDIPYLQSVEDPAGVGHTRKGHGVGVSGVGATYFAVEKGWDYKAILAYYLTGTKVEKKY
ncbi:MAG: SpoIID/LytB domain-containing protein [Patescibacteria group bacterium]